MLDFEEYDSDGSLHSFGSLGPEHEDEFAAINVETNFKAQRAKQMHVECRRLLGNSHFLTTSSLFFTCFS